MVQAQRLLRRAPQANLVQGLVLILCVNNLGLFHELANVSVLLTIPTNSFKVTRSLHWRLAGKAGSDMKVGAQGLRLVLSECHGLASSYASLLL